MGILTISKKSTSSTQPANRPYSFIYVPTNINGDIFRDKNLLLGRNLFLPSLTKIHYMESAEYMRSRKYYRNRFAKFPDVVDVPRFCEMMGAICDKTARKLLRENRVKYYCIRGKNRVPKEWIIDYILSTHYEKYRMQLRSRV